MEFDFSNDMIEKLLFKKTLVDKKWLNIMANVYSEKWFQVPPLGKTLKLMLKYYEKYNSTPSNTVIKALAKKYPEKHPDDQINQIDLDNLLVDISKIDCEVKKHHKFRFC